MSARPRARPAATQNLDANALPVGVPSDLPAGADIRSLFFVQARTRAAEAARSPARQTKLIRLTLV